MDRVTSTSYRLLRSGTLKKTPREVYLKKNNACGFSCCGVPNVQIKKALEKGFKAFVFATPDLLHELIAPIEAGLFPNLLVTRGVLEEVESRCRITHRRLMRVIEVEKYFVFEDANSYEVHQIRKRIIEEDTCRKNQVQYYSGKEYSNSISTEQRQKKQKLTLHSQSEHNGQKKSSTSNPEPDVSSAPEYSLLLYCTVEWYNQHSQKNHFRVFSLESPEVVTCLAPPTNPILDADHAHNEYLTEEEAHDLMVAGHAEKGNISVKEGSQLAGRIKCDINGRQTDVEIPADALNRSIHGDRVVVQITGKKAGKKTGKVVRVERREKKLHACTLKKRVAKKTVILQPLAPQLPLILARTKEEILSGTLVLAWIQKWEIGHKYPTGSLLGVIGAEGSISAETKAILSENYIIDKPFEEQAMLELPPNDWNVSESDLAGREDFREYPVASIDPEGCIDIDDALHARMLTEEKIEVGIHIADVTHFVKEDSSLDREGRIRGCTVYLPNRRIDMLPPLLGTDICSLHKEKERLAFSLVLEVEMQPGTAEVRIANTRFVKSVIKSKESFTYTQASRVLAGSVYPDVSVATSLRLLKKVTQALKSARMQKGALFISSKESRISVGEAELLSEVTDSTRSGFRTEEEFPEEFDTHSLVEELMLLANHCVALETATAFPRASIIRIHPMPAESAFRDLEQAIRTHLPGSELHLDPNDPNSLMAALSLFGKNEYLKGTISSWLTKCMPQAVYAPSASSDAFHYGLAMHHYTHFTSPIRRYADVIAHRILLSAVQKKPVSPYTEAHLETLCQSINRSSRMAKITARRAQEMYAREYLLGRAVDLSVTSISESGVSVFCPEFSVDGTLELPDTDTSTACSSLAVMSSRISLLSTVLGVLVPERAQGLVWRLVDKSNPQQKRRADQIPKQK